MDRDFSDPDGGGYFFTGAHHEILLSREKPDYDGAEPSGNSVALLNLLRLEQFTGERAYRETAEKALAGFSQMLLDHGEAVPKMLTALDFYLDEPLQVVILSPRGVDPALLVKEVRRTFLPNKVLTVVEEGKAFEAQAKELPWIEGKSAMDSKPTAFVCRGRVCDSPTTDPAELRQQLTV